MDPDDPLPEPEPPPPGPRPADEEGNPGELTFLQMVLSALEPGPGTGFELARRVERAWPGFLRNKEGYVYPALLELWRQGEVEASWTDQGGRRRRVYRLAGTPPPGPSPATAATGSRPDAPARLLRTAERCSAGLRFAPRIHEETRLEMRDHLLDARAGYLAMGVPEPEASSRAARDLGDEWRIRTDLRRAARGQRVVAFPRTLYEGLVGIAIYDLRVLLLIMAVMLFVRVQVVTAYHIPTRSMEPTLHGDKQDGDHILVNKLAGDPERFDIVVFDGWGAERRHYVKRVVGLPGESLALREGDLYVDGVLVRKEGAALDALLFPVFDLGDEKRLATRGGSDGEEGGLSANDRLESRLTEGWTVPSRSPAWSLVRSSGEFLATVEEGAPHAAELEWASPVEDAIYDPETGDDAEVGIFDVADQRLTVDVRPRAAGTRVSLRLTRGDEVYEASLAGDAPGVAILVDGREVARAQGVSVPVGRRTRVRFSAVDHVLRLDVGGEQVLRHDLPQPEHPGRTGPVGVPGIVVSAGAAGITPVRLERDVFWTPPDRPLRNPGPDEYFVLGDNSGNSEDSRSRGPIHKSRIVGKPMLVVWPFGRVHVPR